MYHRITIEGGIVAVTTAQIRDLLNRPRGLNEGTISEYITIRTAEVNKKARAIKMLVCVDCLRVLIDTIPTFVPEKERGTQDIRFSKQLASFETSALEAIRAIEEKGGTAFNAKATATRVGGTTSGQLSGSIHPTK